jgi:hypothetical protein
MLEAEWRQFLQGSVGMGTKEEESSTGCVWVVGLTMLQPILAHFETYETFISLIFKYFFQAVVNRG